MLAGKFIHKISYFGFIYSVFNQYCNNAADGNLIEIKIER